MAAFFDWINCTDKTRPRSLVRPNNVKLRIAQFTDPHVPGEMDLLRRLRSLGRPSGLSAGISHQISAVSNEFAHSFRKKRKLYANLLKKMCIGLHQLQVDHLVITGDLTHCGVAPEFLEMRAILEVTGWGSSEKLTVVPGNHDRFNLYEKEPGEPMESFFDVVTSRKPRLKKLEGGIALVEIDSNCDPIDDRHYLERWLPNTVGRIYPEAVDWLDQHRPEIEGYRLVVLVHHHLTTDWYVRRPSSFGTWMKPLTGGDELLECVELIDQCGVILHGHIHEPMAVDYMLGPHRLGCPGGFAKTQGVNLIDLTQHDEIVMTQIALT